MTLEPVNVSGSAKLPFHQHAMLLYSNDEDKSTTKYVNEGLGRGHLTVCVPINTDNNASHMSKMASRIVNYEDDMNRGNLLTLDTRSFYNFELAGDLQPLEELKIMIEEAIQERIASEKNDEVIVVVGIAAGLARNQKFDESINIERWWQKTHSEWLQKGLKVTIICPHSSAMLDKSQFLHYTQALSSLHDITLDLVSKRRSIT
jgi:hypothetical protein